MTRGRSAAKPKRAAAPVVPPSPIANAPIAHDATRIREQLRGPVGTLEGSTDGYFWHDGAYEP